jgi:arginine/lysine/ornithine decarboxylase
MDHTEVPVLDALVPYRRHGEIAFTPPGHKQARGADPAARAILGDAVYWRTSSPQEVSTTGVPPATSCSGQRS